MTEPTPLTAEEVDGPWARMSARIEAMPPGPDRTQALVDLNAMLVERRDALLAVYMRRVIVEGLPRTEHDAATPPDDLSAAWTEAALREAIGTLEGLQVYWLDDDAGPHEPDDQREDEDWADHLARRIAAALTAKLRETR